jgi:hypothetical protein
MSERRSRGFALVALALAGAATFTARDASAQAANEAAAQMRFQRGRDLFVANDFNGALTEFRAANQLVGSPNTRLYIARCLRGLNRLGEAYIEFQRAAAEAADRSVNEPRYAASRDAARQEMDALRPQIGNLTLHAPHAPEGLEVRVGGAVVPSAMFDVPVPTTPGAIEVTATAQGRIAYRQQATVRASATTELTIELRVDPNYVPAATNANSNTNTNNQNNGRDPDSATPPPPRMVRISEGGGVRVGGFVVAAVGVGGIGAFIGFGSSALSRHTQLRQACNESACQPELMLGSQIDQGEMFQTIANIGLIGGGVALVTGTVMIIVGGARERLVPETEARAQARRTAQPQWTGWLAPSAGGAAAGVSGTF